MFVFSVCLCVSMRVKKNKLVEEDLGIYSFRARSFSRRQW